MVTMDFFGPGTAPLTNSKLCSTSTFTNSRFLSLIHIYNSSVLITIQSIYIDSNDFLGVSVFETSLRKLSLIHI